ncbi:MAG TPA: hypothetical protein PLO84_09195 [Thermotogota bacterium]|nr:hypothetical protein [Thermotogota bacterium]
MNREKYVELLKERSFSEQQISESLATVEKMERYLSENGHDLMDTTTEQVAGYVSRLVEQKENTVQNLLALARIFYIHERKEIYIYFLKVLGGIGVIDSIRKRMEEYAGREITEEIFDNLEEPPLGTDFKKIPAFTAELMKRVEERLSPEQYATIFAGNNHGLSEEGMKTERELYEAAESLDAYLKDRHERKVAELQYHADTGKIWFEQQITQDIVDFVKSNQEILSAVRKDDKLYVTKIPYETHSYLQADDDIFRRYFACHCPFARESILQGDEVSANWCYCSAGFAKFPFEQILGRELKVKLLESPLKGNLLCRFEIDISEKN